LTIGTLLAKGVKDSKIGSWFIIAEWGVYNVAMELAEMAETTPRETPSAGLAPLGYGSAGLRGRILVVDDENGPRQALRMLLKEDYEVLLESSVAGAIALIESHSVDIIITDIRMPQQTGLDLLRQVKQVQPGVEVIILTGYGELDTAMEAIDYGAYAYLEKPFDSRVMLAKVAACLEKQRREHERRAMEQLAIDANRFETIGRIVSGAMHDLGTPLSVLGTHIDLLLRDSVRPDLPKRLETMMAQVQHCNDLVRTTMNFLRNSTQEAAPFSLTGAAKMCIEVARPLLLSQNIPLMAELDGGLDSPVGDPVLVRQAILNLIYNACQAMESQIEPRQLRLETYQNATHICLAVHDTGPGVPSEHRQHIFEALFTTKGHGGTGLGLAVVRNIMQRHGGDVTLEEHGGRGARFVLHFPRQTESGAKLFD